MKAVTKTAFYLIQAVHGLTEFETILEDFAFLDDWEERYKYIIDLGHKLEPITEDERTEANKVRGCVSQVWLIFDDSQSGTLRFRGDSDAHIVRGLIALLISLYSGKSKDDILATDARAALAKLDLEDHLTPQRSNGLASMIAVIRNTADRLS